MRRASLVVLASALAAASVPLAPSPAHAGSTALPAGGVLVVEGHGWGHGRGMGQWGSKGMAGAGRTWSQIVSHYYSGVTIGSRSAGEDLRVLLESSSDVVVTSDQPFTVRWRAGATAATSDATFRFLRARYEATAYVIEKAPAHTGPWTRVGSGSGPVTFVRSTTLLQLVYDSAVVRYYRGEIEAWRSSSGSMLAINDLPLEQYLYGVVPREMPASWPAEAVKAQSVAARTYAAYKKDYARSKAYAYDICASTSCQVYGGFAMKSNPTASRTDLESSAARSAIDGTAGKVVLYGGKPILAEYSSSTGGYSSPGSVAYQRAVADSGDEGSPHHDWRATISVSEVESKWPAVGRLADVRVTRRNGYGDWGGRVLDMELVGTAGTVSLTGHGWRSAFAWPGRSGGVRSNWFRVLYWKARLAEQPGSPTLPEGGKGSLVVRIANEGNTSWPVGGVVQLGTTAPSRFAGSEWPSATRAARISRNVSNPAKASVSPGEIAEFRVVLDASRIPAGEYRETFFVTNDDVGPVGTPFPVSVSVVPAWTDEAPGLLANGSFEEGLAAWSSSGGAVSTAEHRHGARSILMPGGTRRVTQSVSLVGRAGRQLVLGGWSKTVGTNASGGAIQIAATVRYEDGSSLTVPLSFARGPHAWTYDETVVRPTKPFVRVDVSASITAQAGSVYFDAVRLVDSPVSDFSFEDGAASWRPYGLAPGDGAIAGASPDGGHSLLLSGDGDRTAVAQSVALSGRRGWRFTLGAWNRVSGSNGESAPSVEAIFVAPDGSRSTAALTFPSSDHEWSYEERVVRAPTDYTRVILLVSYNSASGVAGFDSIRLVPNFLANGGFDAGLEPWSDYRGGAEVSADDAHAGPAALRLEGGGRRVVGQRVALSSGAGQRLRFSIANRTVETSAAGGMVGARLVFRGKDGSAKGVYVALTREPHGWAVTERQVVAPMAFAAIDVYLLSYDQPGTVWFDSVRVDLV